jgi:hypothetical protein
MPPRKSNHFHSPVLSLFVFATDFIGVAVDQASALGWKSGNWSSCPGFALGSLQLAHLSLFSLADKNALPPRKLVEIYQKFMMCY